MRTRPAHPSTLRNIFFNAEKSLFTISPLTVKKISSNLKPFKTLDTNKIDWNKFYELIMFVSFYSGFKAETVNRKYFAIKKTLGKLNVVYRFKETDIKLAIKNPNIIRHETKIRACIHNAKAVVKLKEIYGTLQDYLYSFGNLKDEKNISALKKDLRREFKYLGGITVNHLLADLGLNVVKPDRVLCRIFYRLGLVKSVDDYSGVIDIGQQIANATRLPIRYIDLIFVYYGQVGYKFELEIDNGICLERNPQCNVCNLSKFCNYYNCNYE